MRKTRPLEMLLQRNGSDTLRAGFRDISMSGKDTAASAIQIILNKTVIIDCPGKRYHNAYTLLLRGEDCSSHLPDVTPVSDRPLNPNALRQ